MPYSIKEQACTDSDDNAGNYVVIKDSDGTEMGCHPTKESAQEQITALNTSERKASQEEIDKRYDEFHDAVNMSASEIREWGETECADLASQDPQAVRDRVVRLLETNKDEWGDKEFSDAGKVTSFIARMSNAEQGDPAKEGCPSERDISLKNWGYDPDKSRSMRNIDTQQFYRSTIKPNHRQTSDENVSTFFIAGENVARDGWVLDIDGVDLSSYKDNPVVLWDHGQDPQRGNRPIAKTINLEKRVIDGVYGILATIQWNTDPFAQQIRNDVKNGFISMASIGWIGLETGEKKVNGRTVPTFLKSDMTEFSIVGVGSDKDALVKARAHKMDYDKVKDMVAEMLPSMLDERMKDMEKKEHMSDKDKDEEEMMEDDDEKRSSDSCDCCGESARSDTAPIDTEERAQPDPSASSVPDPALAESEMFERLADSIIDAIDRKTGRK